MIDRTVVVGSTPIRHRAIFNTKFVLVTRLVKAAIPKFAFVVTGGDSVHCTFSLVGRAFGFRNRVSGWSRIGCPIVLAVVCRVIRAVVRRVYCEIVCAVISIFAATSCDKNEGRKK